MTWAPTGIYLPVHHRTLILEISTSGATDDTQVWLNASPYLLASAGQLKNTVVVDIGIDPETDNFRSAMMSLWLDNTARIFDTRNEDSPFFECLQARRQIRLRSHEGLPSGISGDYYTDVYLDTYSFTGRLVDEDDLEPMFRGFVTQWPRSYGLRNQFSWVNINAKDGALILDATDLDDGTFTLDDDSFGMLDGDGLAGTSEDGADESVFQDLTGNLLVNTLDSIDWPSTLRDIAAGVVFAGITDGQESVTGTLRSLVETEQGAGLFWPDGKLGFLSRLWPWERSRSVTVQAYFGATRSTSWSDDPLMWDDEAVEWGGLPFFDVDGVGPDGTRIKNTWRRSGLSGNEIIRIDEAAKNRWGRISDPTSTVLAVSDPDIEGQLDLLMARFAIQVERIDTLVVKGTPIVDGTPLADVLVPLLPLDRIAIDLTPPGGEPYPTHEAFITRKRTEISSNDWTDTFRLSPAALEGLFVLDDDDATGASLLDRDPVLAP